MTLTILDVIATAVIVFRVASIASFATFTQEMLEERTELRLKEIRSWAEEEMLGFRIAGFLQAVIFAYIAIRLWQ